MKLIPLTVAMLLLVLSNPPGAQESGEGKVEPDIFYVPTPYKVVEVMLEVADVGPQDTVYDLGSGDGRIVISAARDRGATGIGVEIDPQYIDMARLNAAADGVTDKVTFVQADLFEIDFTDAHGGCPVPVSRTESQATLDLARQIAAWHTYRPRMNSLWATGSRNRV